MDVGTSSERSFPSLVDFNNQPSERVAGESTAIPFRDLPLNTVYEIKEIKTIHINQREAVILKLQNQEGGNTDVWATTVIRSNLKEKSSERQGKTLFIISKGRKETKCRYYYDFKILER